MDKAAACKCGRPGFNLCREDPLEKEMATHTGTLAWKIPWTEKPGTAHGVPKSQTQLSDFTFTSSTKSFMAYIGLS